MTCRHCGEPIERCYYDPCRVGNGWVHARTYLHACDADDTLGDAAEPEPGTPGGEIAPQTPREVA